MRFTTQLGRRIVRIERIDEPIRRLRAAPVSILVAALILAVIWCRLNFPLPDCALRSATGVPCLTCGSTRLLEALGEGDLLGAAAASPLVFTAIVLMIVWAAGHATGRRLVTTRIDRRILAGLGAVIVAAGWGYSVWRGG